MKNQAQRKPTPAKFSLLRQLGNLIPNHLVPQLARAHAVGLNDVCDALRLHSGSLSAIRGATRPAVAKEIPLVAEQPLSKSPALLAASAGVVTGMPGSSACQVSTTPTTGQRPTSRTTGKKSKFHMAFVRGDPLIGRPPAGVPFNGTKSCGNRLPCLHAHNFL
jgi:hypothetical protein